MSTTFGVLTEEYKDRKVFYEDDYPHIEGVDSEDDECDSEDYFEVVVFRTNGGHLRFMNPIAYLLPDDTKIWALDNSPQGLYTIGEVKKEMVDRES